MRAGGTRKVPSIAAAIAVALVLAGCSGPGWIERDPSALDPGSLPPPNIRVNVAGLGPCTDEADRSLRLDANQPVTVLVHGCYGSSGLFRALAQVLAFHGQQSACFTYNDRDSMMVSSAQLNEALGELGQKMTNKQVTVIGHSQGALISRKALTADRPDPIRNADLQLRLVTVSGPFSGIASANQCGNPAARRWTLGLIAPLCRIATGDKWSEITYSSDFIRKPGRLHPQVRDSLKIVTDERGTCRKSADGICIETDEVFSLEEQRHPLVDRDPTRVVEVRAGHVEIVGDQRSAPTKLIAVLQDNGVLNPTPPHRSASLSVLLSQLYGGTAR